MIFYKLKSLPIWCLFKNWQIRTQILFTSLLIWLLIFCIFFGVIYISQLYLFEMLSKFSYEVFLKQTKSQFLKAWIYDYSIQFTLQHTAFQLSLVSDLHSKIDQMQNNKQLKVYTKPQFCLNKQADIDRFCFNSTITCGIFSQSKLQNNPEHSDTIFMLTVILSSFKIALDNSNESPIYYFNNDPKAQYYCISNGIVFPPAFMPLTRQYYLEHLNKSRNSTNLREVYIESPYQIVANKIRVPMTTNLLSEINDVIGIIAKDIDIRRTSVSRNSQRQLQIIIFNSDGKVLQSELYNNVNQSIYYIYQQNVSGFNQDDYQQILNQLFQQQFENNCQNIQITNILCRYNALQNDDMIIETRNISHTPFYLMLLFSTNIISKQEKQKILIEQEKVNEVLYNTILMNLAGPVGIMLFSQLFIYFIIKQIIILNNDINATLFYNKREYIVSSLFRKKGFFISETISDFSLATLKLFQCSFGTNKSEQCQEHENLKLPKDSKTHQIYKKYLVSKVYKFSSRLDKNEVKYKYNVQEIIRNILHLSK